MKLLLDTHVFFWAIEDPAKLGRKAKSCLQDIANERWVSAVSALELARLVWAGDLSLSTPLDDWISRSLDYLRADSLPVTTEIALEAYRLPEPFHRDPADRMIAASARTRDLTLVTADERILKWHHVSVLDARR